MQTAMRLALRGGSAVMTVRQITCEAEVAAGQLHHRFVSIGELESQVFVRLIREMPDMPPVAEDTSWREQLFSMIDSEDGRLEPYIHLQREGQMPADSDPDIKAAYLLTMNTWHEETIAIIRRGLACGEFHSSKPPADTAWRFIALMCDLDGIYALGTRALDDAAFSRYLNKVITMELFQRTLPERGRDPPWALATDGSH